MFFCEFREITHDASFKELFRRLLLHKNSFCHHDLSLFQKWCHTYFPGEYFLDLICKTGSKSKLIILKPQPEAYLQLSRASAMELFRENS